jgi:succinoglycan biosynthesis transport protein ExoP
MMLETSKPRAIPPLLDHGGPSAEFVSAAELYRAVIGFLRRQYPAVLFMALLTLALAIAYLVVTPPSFTAEAKLIIDPRKVQVFQQQSVIGDIVADSGTVDSQVELVTSDNVARLVIKELHLNEDPEFINPRLGLMGTLVWFVRSIFASAEPSSENDMTRRALDTFGPRLSVKRLALTYVLEIRFRSFSPERAAQIANAVADAYIVDQLEAKYQATRRASAWLQDRIKELRQQATMAERAVVEFKGKNNIVDTGGRLMNEQQLAELNSQLVLARATTAEAKARLERVDQVRRQDVPDATVTDTLRNDVITKLRSQYLDLANREADLSRRYGSGHLAAVNFRNQMREIRLGILDELGRIAQSYKSDYEIAKAREDSVTQSLADIVSQSQTTNQAQIALRELEGTAQTYRALHDNFLQRYMESVQQQSFPITEARLISSAAVPTQKSHPKVLLVLAGAIVGGMVLGLGAAMLRDFSDGVFRTGSQVERTLYVDCLAIVPALKATEKLLVPRGAPPKKPLPGSRVIVHREDRFWTIIDSPFSRFAEALRTVKVAVDVLRATKGHKVIGMTSSLPNEGKSTMSMALALLMAQAGARTIVIDGDLRNPSLSRRLAPEAEAGVLEVISGHAALGDVAWIDPATDVTFMPAFVPTRMANTSDILSSDATRRLFDQLREHYDCIIVDLPPLAPVVDVRVTTPFVDSFIFVIEWGRTRIDMAEHALRGVRGVYDNLLGVVLNKANLGVLNRYERYLGNYHHNKDYARYGYLD